MNVLPLLVKLKRLDINIKLVDGQLKIDAPEGALTPVLIEELKREKSSIVDYLQNNLHKKVDYESIEPSEKKEYYALSSAQKRLYFLQRLEPDRTVYNVSDIISLPEDVPIGKLDDAFTKLIKRHESLRTSFQMINDSPVQKIHETVEFEIEYNDLKSFIRPFDLSQAPLLRIGLLKNVDGSHILLVDIHHIVTDGTSQGVLRRDFMSLIKGEERPELRIQYKDFSEWQNGEKGSENLKRQEEFWLKEFERDLPVLDLPTDYPRPAPQSFDGNSVLFEISLEETRGLNAMALKGDSTLFMELVAIVNILLSKLSGQEDIIIGTPIAGRTHADLEKIIGMFVNTLSLRNNPAGDLTFGEFLEEVKERTLMVYENQEYPFEELVEKLSVKRDMGRNPVFDIMFVLQNMNTGNAPQYKEPGFEIERTAQTAKFDITLTAAESEGRLFLSFQYCTKLFKKETIDRFVIYLKKIVSIVLKDPGIRLNEIEIISEEEKKRLLYDFNDTEAEYPKDITIHELFRGQAEKTPDSIAIVGASPCFPMGCPVCVTYRKLNEQSDNLAHLLKEKGVGSDNIIGLMVERSVEMIIGIMGIVKPGAAYLPIDPDSPQERIDYMLKDSGAKLLITADNLKEFPNFLTSQLPNFHLLPATGARQPGTSLAYIIYTSGTTGKPKGVMIERRNLVNLIFHQYKNTNIDFARVLQFATISFDVSAQEIFSTLLAGGQLYLVNKEIRADIPELFRLIERNGIKTVFLPISLLKAIFNEEENINRIPLSIRHIVTAGEQVVISNNFRKYLRERKVYLHNHYGPSETHVVTALTIDPEGEIAELPSIGKPVMNTEIYIIDKLGRLSPLGIVGEIWIGGAQVGRGYLNRPELTAERFIHQGLFLKKPPLDPTKTFATNNPKLYRTGDLARWLDDGNIEFLGRIDHQVKVRGFRIELGEIEIHLLNISGIKEAVVLALEEGNMDKYLCAYIVSDREYRESELRESLLKKLPDYMIPTYFVRVEKIPLTSNRKVDRKALPAPKIKSGEGKVAPRNIQEEKLAGIFSQVLGIEKDKIGIDDNFFHLGGHSLKATQLVSKIHKVFDTEIPLREVFKAPTIRGLSNNVKESVKDRYVSIDPVEKKEYYIMSSAQKRIYALHRMDEQGTVYNLPYISILEGDLDKDRVEDVFHKLISRHESLRTSFHLIEDLMGDKPVQKIHENVEFKIEAFDLATIESFIRPFDLSKAPLFRVGFIEIEEKKHIFMVDMSHSISDGVSIGVLVKDFMSLYEGVDLAPNRIQYKDYSEWLESAKHVEAQKGQEEYWLNRFIGEIPTLDLLVDFSRPNVQSFEGHRVNFELSKEISGALRTLALETGATLYMVLLALYNVFLSKLNNREDIVIGSPIAGRRHTDLENIIGMFVNTLAMRNNPVGEKPFARFLHEVKEVTLKAFENQDYQYEDLVERVNAPRDVGRNPIFDTMFVLQNVDTAELVITGLKLRPYKYEIKTAKFDLTLSGIEFDDKLVFAFEYSVNLFKQETIDRFIEYFKKIVNGVIENRDRKISEIEIILEEEKRRILNEFNDTERDYPKEKTIQELFRGQAEKTPDRIALVGAAPRGCPISLSRGCPSSLTYKELDKQSDYLAHELQEKGIQPGEIVGIKMERSVEMIIGVFGILKAGAAYLPIDPNYPQERIDYMLKDSGAKLSITTDNLKEFPNFHLLPATGNRQPATSLAYIIYTSGSTGKPKGVIVEHRSLVNLCSWHNIYYAVTSWDRATKYAGVGFDASVWEIFPYMVIGASLYIVPEEIMLEIEALNSYYEKNGITIGFLPTQVCEQFMEIDNTSLRVLVTGGDKLRKYKKKNYRLYNNYGPTENTVVTTNFNVTEEIGNIPIGKPLFNIELYIFDKNNNLHPIGTSGELCISGIGLARGYLNRPELTSEKFISLNTKTIYKTGDLARWLDDGNIEYLGRIDQQVKIRGNRIELGEIEKCLISGENIKDAVVIDRNDKVGDKYLCAYIVSGKELAISELRETLSKELPDYMIPSYFVRMEKIPLTSSGKIDRNVLPNPDWIGLRQNVDYIPPTNAIEKKLVEIWEKVLGRTNIGINDNFFNSGGDSIKSIQVISRMSGAGYKLEMKDIFQYPVIAKLAMRVKKSKRIPDQSVITGTIPLTPIQVEFFNNSYIDPHHYNQAVMLYSKEGFDKEAITEVFTKIQERHDALRMAYKRDEAGGEVIQVGYGLDYPLSLEEYDKIEEGIQSRIDLEKGPMMKLGLFHLNDGDRLLIVIHHLVIDGVSWRIVFEDIETLLGQYKRGEKLELPPKTDSYKLWSEKLQEYSNSKEFLKERAYWQKIGTGEAPSIPKDFEEEGNDNKDTQNVSFSLGEEETEHLLTKVNRAYKTEINDILLTALGMALKKTFGNDRISLALEGHGREEIQEEIDISRTVGWFTGVYPVLLDISYADDPGRQVKEIKETLRRIPKKGIGYGILKYLTKEENKKEVEFKLKPQISFNYLGQIDSDVTQKSFFQIAKESVGNLQSLKNRREYLLDVSGMTANNRLTMNISYNKLHFKPETMNELTGNFETELCDIITYCSTKEKSELTPSDFTTKGLTIERVDRLMDEYPGIEDIYTLTPMQEGMLFHAIADETSYSYFEQMSYRLQGELEIRMVEKSLNELFKRHEILRTSFEYKDIQRPVQVVLKEREIDFYYEDIRKKGDREEKEKIIKEFKKIDKERTFDLRKDSLMRVTIHRVEETEYEFTWSYHHILMDGWCIGILNSEFFAIYTGNKENKPYRLPGVKPYRTYIQWLEKQDKEKSARYWGNVLDLYEERTGAPKIRSGKKGESRRINESVTVKLEKEKTVALNKLAVGNQVTLNTVTQAVWGILLGKLNNREDVVFGAVVSGRPYELEGVENMIGLFINTIPVRIRYTEGMKFNTLLRNIQDDAISAEPHHYHPLAEIQARSALKQNLIDHLFIFENYPIAEQIEGNEQETNKGNKISLKLANVEVFEQTSYDLTVVLAGTERLTIKFQYNGAEYDRDYIEKIAGRFIQIVDRVIENEEIKIEELTILSEEEKRRILYDFNNTAAEYPKDKTIHELFRGQAEKTPDHIALLGSFFVGAAPCCPVSLTYKELDNQTNSLSHELQERGIQPGDIVGIQMERSIEMIAALLGILKSGGAYLPIDPNYPQERIDYMLKDSRAKLLITTDNLKEFPNLLASQLPNFHLLPATGNRQPATSLAYIIYTSGTTGRPKGVLVESHSLVRLVKNTNYIQWEEADKLLLTGSIAFDIVTFEIWGPLCNGAMLSLAAKEVILNAEKLKEVLVNHDISILHLIPQLFEQLAAGDIEIFAGLRYFLVGGDLVRPAFINVLREKYSQLKIRHMYGPTENTTFSTYFPVERNYELKIPIGYPISNTTVYIYDKYGHLQPVGVMGELCVGGAGIARGYLNNPELTNDKFIMPSATRNPFEKGVLDLPKLFANNNPKLYRTGDLARWIDDGAIEFLGRIDTQVKIRGFRIELGEIENTLLKYKSVRAAAAQVNENNLCAYIVAEKELSAPELREYLSGKLPDYMIPSYFVQLEKIPLNANGKIDIKALPEPKIKTGERYVAPKNEVEEKLVEIWASVLEIETNKIGVEDSFFELGGHSLKVTVLVSRIHKEFNVILPIGEVFKTPFIRALSEKIRNTKKLKYTAIEPIEKKEYYNLSSAQKRLFVLDQMNPDSTAYNMPEIISLPAEFDLGKIEKTFKKLIKRHESLRTSFRIVNEEPVQRIHDDVEFKIEYLATEGTEDTERRLRPFNLAKAPLMRVGIIEADEKSIMIVDMNHIISDGVSHEILVKDYQALYDGEELPPLNVQYKDFSSWQNNQISTGKIETQEKYWLNIYSDSSEIPKLDLPTDYPRPTIYSYEGEDYRFKLKGENVAGLKRRLIEHNVTPFMCLLAVYNILLFKYTGQETIIIGCDIAGRPHADLEPIIGMFVNELAIRNHPERDKTYIEFLKEVKKTGIVAFENQEYQFAELVEKLKIERDISRNPLFDVQFAYHEMEKAQTKLEGISLTPYRIKNQTAKFDLALDAYEGEDEIVFCFQYRTALYKQRTIEAMAKRYLKILNEVIENPGQRLGEITMIDETERRQILFEFNNTKKEWERDKLYIELFERQVEKAPDRVAARYKNETLTYNELDKKAKQLAGNLYHEKSIRPNDRVGIWMERSNHYLIAILGVMKAGAAYIPIETELPEERVKKIIEDAEIGVIITGEKYWESEKIEITATPNDLAYIIYTSGSTGQPKGVMIHQQGMINHLNAKIEDLGINEDDIIAQTASAGFDISVWQFLAAIIVGGVTHIIEKEIVLSPLELLKTLRQGRVTILETVPSLMTVFLDVVESESEKTLTHLKWMIPTGEPLTPALVKKWTTHYPGIKLVNAYGPTEASDDVTHHIITSRPTGQQTTIPIGKPIRNTHIYIMDGNLSLCPVGVRGEICVAGIGVGKGYWKDPQKTSKSFIPNPNIDEIKDPDYAMLYRTGDIGYFTEDGTIECLGRKDHQVKIRGNRIELEEIENRILNYGSVKEVVVIEREDEPGSKYLCAYITGRGKLEIPGLKDYLSKHLPGYMVPASIVELEKIPLTPNGKIDRRALPKPNVSEGERKIAPENEVEEKLVEIWASTLNIEKNKIGVEDNFFELGGHSLSATVLVARIHKEFNVILPLGEVFKAPNIRSMSEKIQNTKKLKYTAIEPVEKKEYYRLSSAQKRLYILQRMNPDSTAYNMPEIIPLPGTYNLEKIEQVFKTLIKRHESLRTSFHMQEGEPVQRIHDEVEFEIMNLPLAKVLGLPRGRSSLFEKGRFDLSKAPLIRVGIIKEENGKSMMIVDMNHIISDGISHEILVKDYQALYDGEELPALRVQYKDFSEWQNGEKEKGNFKKQEEYWIKEYEGEIPVLDLPTDYPRPVEQSFEGDSVRFEINSDETGALNARALKGGYTLFMELVAIYNILLSKLSGQEDIVIGTPIAGRRHVDLEKIIGMFVNTLSLRNNPAGNRRFGEFLEEVKEKTVMAFENQEYPFEELVDTLSIKRDIGRNPLFDIMIVLENENTRKEDREKESENEKIFQPAKFDLTLSAEERGGGLNLSFQYSTKLFKRETIERFALHFKKIVSNVVNAPGERINEIEIISEEEKNRILYDFNITETAYPKDKTIHELFRGQAEKTPDHIALVGAAPCCPVSLTYKELDKRSNSLAHELHEKGIQPGAIVGIQIERSIEMIVGILGILKAGGAYLPIEPEYPQERIDYMLKDSGAKLLITADNLKEFPNFLTSQLPNFHLLPATGNRQPATSLAYIIYTSGSTGKPKGVLTTHRNVTRVVRNTNYIEIKEDDRVLQLSSYAFDGSVFDIYGALLNSAALVMVRKEEILEVARLAEWIKQENVTVFFVTTALFNTLVELRIESFERIRNVLFGGERISVEHTGKALEKMGKGRIIHVYGPTETTVYAAYYFIDEIAKEAGTIPIGKAISNTTIYILDENLKPAPIGIKGEIYIGGPGVARGYLNNPELTAERFISFANNNPKPKTQNPKLYRTGDLARWLDDGNIEFIGRKDNQVKIRGFRIELGEIENKLLKVRGVKEAVVLAKEEKKGEKYLCAYYVSEREYEISELRERLSIELPDYMIPAYFVPLEKIPLTTNGKVDIKALPSPLSTLTPGENSRPPTQEEEKLIGIWSGIVGIEKNKIGIDQNLFELGGNSLHLISFVSKIHRELGIEIPVAQIFEKPTISGIAFRIKTSIIDDNPVTLLNGPAKKKLFLFPPQIAYGASFKSLSSTITDHSFYAFNFIEEDDRLEQYVRIITTIQPEGPYILFGYSAAGSITCQVARELEKRGHEVSDIIFVECFFTGGQATKIDEEALKDEYIIMAEYLESMGLHDLKEKMIKKSMNYMKYIATVDHLEKINATVHLLLTEEYRNNEQDRGDSKCWDHVSTKTTLTYEIIGTHRTALNRGIVEKNAEVIKQILDRIESDRLKRR